MLLDIHLTPPAFQAARHPLVTTARSAVNTSITPTWRCRKAWTDGRGGAGGLFGVPALVLVCGALVAAGLFLLRGPQLSAMRPATVRRRAAEIAAGAQRDLRVYDDAYLPALERLPAPMAQCIAERAELPESADLAAQCASSLWCFRCCVLSRGATTQSHSAEHQLNLTRACVQRGRRQ